MPGTRFLSAVSDWQPSLTSRPHDQNHSGIVFSAIPWQVADPVSALFGIRAPQTRYYRTRRAMSIEFQIARSRPTAHSEAIFQAWNSGQRRERPTWALVPVLSLRKLSNAAPAFAARDGLWICKRSETETLSLQCHHPVNAQPLPLAATKSFTIRETLSGFSF